jgi:hypothetical protein
MANDELTKELTLKEIKEAIAAMLKDKASGCDGIPMEFFSGANRRDLPDPASSILGNAQKGGDVRVDQQRSHYANPQIGRPRQDRELEADHASGESLQDPGQNIG